MEVRVAQDWQLRVSLLGPLECWTGTTRIHLGGPVQERLLASLLLVPGQVVSVTRLVDSVWGHSPPATATHQVRKAVARLRQLIPGGAELIVTDGPGYRAAVGTDQLDLTVFSSLLDQARRAATEQRLDDAVDNLQSALALWRGPVMGGNGGTVVDAAGVVLQEHRLTALEQLVDLRLARGEANVLVGDLREHVAAHPLREVLRGQLMLALFRSGRQAEALEEYGRVRTLLADELGIDPGAQLVELYERMLRNDAALAGPEPTASAQASRLRAPEARAVAPHRTLPSDLPDFVGRKQELESLLRHVDSAVGPGTRIIAIDGMGGVGKTTLAVRVAYLLADRFPDGQVYIDLRGFTPNELPLSAEAVADALLRMVGMPKEHVLDDATARIAQWRTTVANSRMLLLLDNAYDVAQVRPLLPPNSDSLLLLTSRTRLIDLDGAYWTSVGTMTAEDSLAMAVGMLSERRTATEPEAVAALTELCGYLPLALRIAVARLANRPQWTIQYIVDRMSDELRRLDELRSGERSVELTLKLSYEGLDKRRRSAFRLLGLHPGRHIDVWSAAALLGTSMENAEETMELLLDNQMMQQHEIGYYTFHDLVRSFVRRLVGQGDEGSEPDAAEGVRRLLDYLIRVTNHVCDLLFPGRLRLSSDPQDGAVRLPPLSSIEQAREWLDREQTTLRAAVTLAYDRGLDRHVAHLARNLVFHLDTSGKFNEYLDVARLAVAASRRLDDRMLLRVSLSNLSVANWKLGQFDGGIAAAAEGLDIAVELGDRWGIAKDTGVLGLLMSTTGRFDDALPLLRNSISLKRELGAGRAEAESLVNLSTLYEHWGRYAEAAFAARRAMELNQELGIRPFEIIALMDLSLACLGLDANDEADARLARARDLVEVSTPAGDVALVFALSALTCHRLGRPDEATGFAERALELGPTYRAPVRQAVVNNVVGRLRRRENDHAAAVKLHQTAYGVAEAIGYRVEEARALRGVAEALIALGDTAAGQEHHRHAEELFDTLGIPPDARY
jgi:DNA-binding SARP family transcriptional activator/tetratricopeptide (TPR) repeat protein